MPPLVADPPTHSESNSVSAERLRQTMAATRVSFTWFGVRKSLSMVQKERAADSFAAEPRFLSAAKKLLDTRHPSYQPVTALKGRVLQFWKSLTLPYPEPGIRLIRHRDLTVFQDQLRAFQDDLHEAVSDLDAHYDGLKEQAREQLGDLYNPADYPPSLAEEFALTWDYPSLEPPNYLRQLAPELYETECRRAEARFSEAIQLAEQAFLEELSQLVGHLAERLSGERDGRPKVFRDSALENLTAFFERFRRLNVGSNAELDQLVEQARSVLAGVAAKQLRESGSLRQRIAGQLAGVEASLDGLLVDRPRRSIVRPTAGVPR